MSEAQRSSNGSVPDAQSWAAMTREADAIREAEDAQLGGKIRWVAKHWAKTVGAIAILVGFWQWNVARIKSNVLADEAEKHQAAQVQGLVVGRDAQTEVDKQQNARLDGIDSRVSQVVDMSKTVINVLAEQPATKRALRKDKKLAEDVQRALEVEPLPAAKPTNPR